MKTYDLIVIGAGMAGVAAANKCGAAGWSVAIVDSLPYGGTCALRGCDPKKILRRGAEVIDAANLMRGKGIDPGIFEIPEDHDPSDKTQAVALLKDPRVPLGIVYQEERPTLDQAYDEIAGKANNVTAEKILATYAI